MFKRKTLALFIVVLVGMALFLTGCGGSSAEDANGGEEPGEAFELTYGSYLGSGHYQAEIDEEMFDRIEEQSNGAITTELFYDGTLVDAGEWRQELLRGTADIVQAAVGSERDRYQLEYAVALFNYGITDLNVLLDFTRELVDAVPDLASEYKEVVPLYRMSAGQSWVHSVDKPIRTPEDLEGLNIKVADEASVALVQAIGGNPVDLPISETYVALETGTLDAVITGPDPLNTFKFAEVTQYSTMLPYATPWLNSRMMNKDVFESMPSEYQDIILENAAWWEDQLVGVLEQEAQAGLDLAIEEGNEIIELTDEERQAFLDILEENALEMAEELDSQGLNGTELFENARQIADQMTQ